MNLRNNLNIDISPDLFLALILERQQSGLKEEYLLKIDSIETILTHGADEQLGELFFKTSMNLNVAIDIKEKLLYKAASLGHRLAIQGYVNKYYPWGDIYQMKACALYYHFCDEIHALSYFNHFCLPIDQERILDLVSNLIKLITDSTADEHSTALNAFYFTALDIISTKIRARFPALFIRINRFIANDIAAAQPDEAVKYIEGIPEDQRTEEDYINLASWNMDAVGRAFSKASPDELSVKKLEAGLPYFLAANKLSGGIYYSLIIKMLKELLAIFNHKQSVFDWMFNDNEMQGIIDILFDDTHLFYSNINDLKVFFLNQENSSFNHIRKFLLTLASSSALIDHAYFFKMAEKFHDLFKERSLSAIFSASDPASCLLRDKTLIKIEINHFTKKISHLITLLYKEIATIENGAEKIEIKNAKIDLLTITMVKLANLSSHFVGDAYQTKNMAKFKSDAQQFKRRLFYEIESILEPNNPTLIQCGHWLTNLKFKLVSLLHHIFPSSTSILNWIGTFRNEYSVVKEAHQTHAILKAAEDVFDDSLTSSRLVPN